MNAVTNETVLFSGEIGTQRVRVWLEWQGDDLQLLSHDIGPGLERFFGDDEIETYLTVKAAQLPELARALGCPADPASIQTALMDRYRDDAAATTHLRAFLEDAGIPYDFFVT
jgi:hypothetical protein